MSLRSERGWFEINFRTAGTWFLFIKTKFNEVYGEESVQYINEFINFVDCNILHGIIIQSLSRGKSWGEIANEIDSYTDKTEDIDKIISMLRLFQKTHNEKMSYLFKDYNVNNAIRLLNESYYNPETYKNSHKFRTECLSVLVEFFEQNKLMKKL